MKKLFIFLGDEFCGKELLKNYQDMPDEFDGMKKVLLKGRLGSYDPHIEIEVVPTISTYRPVVPSGRVGWLWPISAGEAKTNLRGLMKL